MFDKKTKPKTPKRDDYDVEFIGEGSTNTRVYLDEEITASTYSIYLDDEILEAKYYREELQILQNATEHDTIFLRICSPGGIEDTALLFVDTILASNAKVIAIIGPDCSSAAAIIALACDSWGVTRFSQLMMHNVSYGVGHQKERDVYDYVNFSRKRSERIGKILCAGFLTQQEYQEFQTGRDLWFDSDDLLPRLKALAEYRKKLREQEEAEEIYEELEFDEKNPLTWPEGTVVEFLKAHSPFKKGERAEITGFSETKGVGEIIELAGNEDKWALVLPYDFEKLKFITVIEDEE